MGWLIDVAQADSALFPLGCDIGTYRKCAAGTEHWDIGLIPQAVRFNLDAVNDGFVSLPIASSAYGVEPPTKGLSRERLVRVMRAEIEHAGQGVTTGGWH